jgi:hypothetical protein
MILRKKFNECLCKAFENDEMDLRNIFRLHIVEVYEK